MFGSWADKTILILLLVTGFNVAASIVVAAASYIYVSGGGFTSRYSWWWVRWCSSGSCSTSTTVNNISSCLGGINLAGGIFSIVVFLMFCGLGFALLATQAAISQLRHGTTSLPGLSFGRRFLSSRLSLPKGSHPKVLVVSMPVIWVLQLLLITFIAVLYHTGCSNMQSIGGKYDVGFIVLIISFLVLTAVYVLFVFSPSKYIPANADAPNATSSAMGTAQHQQQQQPVFAPVHPQQQQQQQPQVQVMYYGQVPQQPQTFSHGQPQQQQRPIFYGGPVYGQPTSKQPAAAGGGGVQHDPHSHQSA